MANTSNTEPAGAERFRAFTNQPKPEAALQPPHPVTVEDRLAALEEMVHEIALHTISASTHPGVRAWMRGIGAKIKRGVGNVL